VAAIWHGAAEVQVHTHCHNASTAKSNQSYVPDSILKYFFISQLPIGPDLKPELTQRVSWDGQDMKPGLVVRDFQ